MSTSWKNLNVAVIRPTGLTGSHVVVELLNQGHSVTGLSRNPGSIGTHPRYKLGPHSGHVVYLCSFVEGVRKIVLAVKDAFCSLFYHDWRGWADHLAWQRGQLL